MAKNPELKDSAFIVGADPKQGRGRGVVLAYNYPARKFGVHSGMPISRAWELCPNARYVFPNHKLYGEVSSRVMAIIREFTNKMEQVSIDEAYLDFSGDPAVAPLTGEQRRNHAIRSIAAEIKKRIGKKENITCSIGVSNSKIVSKIATDMNKPDGLTIADPSRVKEFLAPLPVGKIPGVGRVSQKILLDSFKIETISDLGKVPLEDLKEKFGRSALWFKNIAEGIDDESEVITDWEPVSQSGETTFDEDESDYEKVSGAMREVAKDVHKRAAEGYLFRNIGIKIRFAGFETHTRSRTLSAPTDSLDVVNRECEKLLSEFASSGRKVRLIGVRLSSLERKRSAGNILCWSGRPGRVDCFTFTR